MENALEKTQQAPEPVEVEPKSGPLTVEQAYDRLQDKKDEQAAETPKPKATPEATPEPVQEPTEAAWTNEDVRELVAFEQAAQQFQADLQAFAQAKQVDITALEKQDKSKAAALRQDIQAAEHELRQRHQTLTEAAQALTGRLQEQQAGRIRAYLDRERAKLTEAVPDLDTEALSAHLREVGFSDDDIAKAADHRLLVMAEESRRYRAMTQTKTPKRRPSKQRKAEPDERAPILEHINRVGMTKENATDVLRARGPKKGKPSHAEAMAKLKRTGSMDDAYAAIKARRRTG